MGDTFTAWVWQDDAWQTQERPVPDTNSCAGACCAVFPLGFTKAGVRKREPFIADMVIRLSRRAAARRYRELGYGALPSELDQSMRLYTCRHWDADHRLCTVYDQRPDMCRDYPYGTACPRPGCEYRQPIAYFVREATKAYERLKPYQSGDGAEL